MFGYITINKNELKFKDYDIYHSFYCGLCRSLKSQYGLRGQISLSYDMTFLEILLSGLYEPKNTTGTSHCIAHPFEKHSYIENDCVRYTADMNLLLTYYKCIDDWNDEKKLSRKLYSSTLISKIKDIESSYPEKCKKISELMKQISDSEHKNITDLDFMSGLFGQIMGEIFAYRKDEWTDSLRMIGFYLGKFIYLADAYEDIEKDIKGGTYNPFFSLYETEQFEPECRRILTMMISECCRIFEMLPIIEYTDILRNILYSGIWFRFDLATSKRANAAKSS